MAIARGLTSAACLLLFMAGVAGVAYAQEKYPNKPIRIVVPYAEGGAGTIIARLVGQKLTEVWGQQVIVDSRPGASGMIGADIVAKGRPDGYTLLAGYTPEVAINVSLFSKMTYDPLRDFTPIALTAVAPMILLVHPSVPVKSVKDLIDLARQRPGDITYGSVGNGSPAHLAYELLNRTAKIKMTHVPYKGAAPALTDLLGGHIFTFFSGMPPAMPHVHAGRLRGLAVSTARRSSAAPNIPTVAESGIQGFDFPTWFSLLAPSGTSPEVVLKLNAEVVRIVNAQAMKSKLAELGAEAPNMSPSEFAAFVKSEISKYAKIVKESGVRAD